MRRQALGVPMVRTSALAALILVGICLVPAFAQVNNNNNNNNQGGNFGGTPAGVAVDAQGVVRTQTVVDPDGRLWRQQVAAARSSLAPDLIRFSALRKVSLNRLEAALRANNGSLTEEMRYLAGLQRVRYVFFYPESKDIVIAGPAEGWAATPLNRAIGLTSGRPVLQLQDLVVALRAFPPDRAGTPLIFCSIDPTPEGLSRLQQFLGNFGSRATPDQTEMLVVNLRNSLGAQKITVTGVSTKTRFAQVIVEADYRMKLIGIGLEQPPVRMVSFVDKVNPAAVSRNALFRWWFVPDYQCVRVSKDRNAMELVGDGVKLVGEDELVSAQGARRASGKSSQASLAFCNSFTQKYSQLAERSPVYAELRNLIDLSVAAAFIQEQNYYDKAGWKMELFGDEKSLAVETCNAPKQVESAVAAIWKGNRLMTPIGGGVQIQPGEALKSDNLLADEDGKLTKTHREVKVELAEGQWWWD